jgi:hypothetical protein
MPLVSRLPGRLATAKGRVQVIGSAIIAAGGIAALPVIGLVSPAADHVSAVTAGHRPAGQQFVNASGPSRPSGKSHAAREAGNVTRAGNGMAPSAPAHPTPSAPANPILAGPAGRG